MTNYLDKEINLYDEVISFLEWEVSNRRLINNFMPIVVNKKILVQLTQDNTELDDNMITFRPMRNNRHCQFLIDFMFDDNVRDVITTRNDDRTYNCKVVNNDGELVINILNATTETEGKFLAFYKVYISEEVDVSGINQKPIKKEYRDPKVITEGQQKAMKIIETKLGKKFSGKTFNGAQKFINTHFEIINATKGGPK